VKFREGRTGRNPRTGALVSVGSKAVPLFRSGKGMKSLLTSHAHGRLSTYSGGSLCSSAPAKTKSLYHE
jgi:hypothetical protein